MLSDRGEFVGAHAQKIGRDPMNQRAASESSLDDLLRMRLASPQRPVGVDVKESRCREGLPGSIFRQQIKRPAFSMIVFKELDFLVDLLASGEIVGRDNVEKLRAKERIDDIRRQWTQTVVRPA